MEGFGRDDTKHCKLKPPLSHFLFLPTWGINSKMETIHRADEPSSGPPAQLWHLSVPQGWATS